jgi:DNA polymerase-3 subunit alpha
MAMVALYRPGPMDFIPEYIARKHNPALIDYPHESLKEDLEKSFGLLIYQEDVMYTAIKLAGYSWLDADKFRKAMGKKIPELMLEQEEKFKSGCIKNGIDVKTVDDLWERIKPFAAYAFNKAHSASYGWLAYQTSYLKANYPYEYMASVLSADSGDTEKIAETVSECRRMHIDVLPPDVNESFGTFTVIDEDDHTSIRFGLYSIKNVGEGVADAIIEARTQGGAFISIEDFLERVPARVLNRKALESLIKSGSLDRCGERGALLECVEDMLKYGREEALQPQSEGLFGGMEASSNNVITCMLEKHTRPAPSREKLKWERELLGIYVSGHPLDQFKDKLEKHACTIEHALKHAHDGVTTSIIGIIDTSRETITKGGKKMAFLRMSDLTGTLEVVIFPDTYTQSFQAFTPNSVVLLEGKMSHRNGEPSLVVERAREL